MNNDLTRSSSSITRRTALAGLGAGSLSLAATLGLGSRLGHVAAQEATPEAALERDVT
jgi:hypothetical protein